MKKLYIAPETNVHKLNPMSSILTAGSVDSGSVPIIDDGPVGESDFTDATRDDNNNRGNVWDNAW